MTSAFPLYDKISVLVDILRSASSLVYPIVSATSKIMKIDISPQNPLIVNSQSMEIEQR